MIYRFLSPAERDLSEAVDYYVRAAPGLGLEFLDEIERTIARILMQPEAWRSVSEHHRRCLTRRFPHGIVYSLDHDPVVIAAVMDLRRDPIHWRRRD